MNEELLEEFVKWYWKEIQGKPYQVSGEEIVKWFLEDKQKNNKKS
jgi:hypothetical protein